MFARFAAMTAALAALASCAPPQSSVTAATHSFPPIRQACDGRDGWSDPAPPAQVFGNTYYVGTCGIAVLLVTDPDGHILIDGATDEAVPSILANIRALGFDPRDVKIIVGSHEHVDHMGGFAALKAATGARLMVREPARTSVETGRTDSADPQAGIIPDMKPVAVDAIFTDGEVVRVGANALTAIATPGHTSGGTSWNWQSCEGPQCRTIAYVDSLSAVSRDDYRFSDHPDRVAPFRETFSRVERMPCDILITPHPGASNLFDRLSGAQPLIDDQACRRLVQLMRTRLDARLAQEAKP